MYTDKKKKRWPIVLVLAICICVCIYAVYYIRSVSSSGFDEDAAAAIKDAVARSARQCYVVEGVYPPDLEYLTDNYGLQINTEDFYITYNAFASNLPPNVKVTVKNPDLELR